MDIILLYIKCFVVGALVGIIFGALKLPVPAPHVFEGVLGIAGIFFGYKLILMLWG